MTAADTTTIRVLVVDDSVAVRSALCLTLGFHPRIEVVGEASDGAEAVQLAGSLRPDLVLIDMRMPVLDGLAASRLLLEQQPAPRIVMLSAYTDTSAAGEAEELGIERYLCKGVPAAEVLAAVLGE